MPADRDKRLIARRFDRQAEIYESVTPVQSVMADRLMRLALKAFPDGNAPLRVLDVGCGTGRFSRRFVRAYPKAMITGVDIAPAMIEKARAVVPSGEFVVGDAEDYVSNGEEAFDVIASNAALQWFSDPLAAIHSCRQRLAPGGILAMATFGDGTFHELRESFHAAYRHLGKAEAEHVHHLPSADYWRKMVPEFVVDEEKQVLTFPSVRDFLHSVQRAGATHSPAGRSTLTRSLYRAMEDHYRKNFSRPSGICVTYHVVYLSHRRYV